MSSDHLLPPNATAGERALAGTCVRLSGVPVPVGDLWNPQACPAALLPWLAWALSVDTWSPDWTEQQKRDAIAASYFVHRHKGTAGAVKAALGALGYTTSVLEWFQEQPPAAPYTFAVDIEVTDQGIDEAVYLDAERIANSAKNTRSHLSRVRAIARTDAALYLGAATTAGELASVLPYQLSELVARAAAYVGAAVGASETVSIYPEAAAA